MYRASAKSALFNSLEPHPRWRWGAYPLRWLLGGLWSLWHRPIRGSLFGIVFFAVAHAWSRAAMDFTGSSIALATALTGLTLVLAPRLTAALLGEGQWRWQCPEEIDEQREGVLMGLGALLLMFVAIAGNAALAGFALLYNGDVPPLDGLFAAVFSWPNAPLALLLVGIAFVAGLCVQLVVVLPAFLLSYKAESDPFALLRTSFGAAFRNWRPLVWWSLVSQLLLIACGGLLPISLVLLAPLVALGSGWACREMACRAKGSEPIR